MRIESRPLPQTLPNLGDLPPLLTRLYAARGVQSAEELDKGLARLIPYQQLKGVDAAVELLVDALEKGQRILYVGDFDADGATASSVGVLALRMLGAAWVDYLVPNRFEYGYGLTPEIVAVALEKHPELLVTVDNAGLLICCSKLRVPRLFAPCRSLARKAQDPVQRNSWTS